MKPLSQILLFYLITLSKGIKTMLPAHDHFYGTYKNRLGKSSQVDKTNKIGYKRFKDSIEFLNYDFALSKPSLSEIVLVPPLSDWPKGHDLNSKIISHKNSLLLYILQISHLLASTQQVIIPLDFQVLKYHSLKSQLPIQLLITSLALLFKLSIPIKTLSIEFKVINGVSEQFKKLVKTRLVELIREVERLFNAPPMVIKVEESEFNPVKVETTPLLKLINYLQNNNHRHGVIAQSPTLILYRRQLNQLEIKMIEEFQSEIEKLGLDDLADNLQSLVYQFQNKFVSLGLKLAPKNVNYHSILQVVHQNFTNRLKSVADGMLAYAILQGGYYPRHSILKSTLGEMMGLTGRIFPFWLVKLVRRLKLPVTLKFNYLSPDAFGFSNYFQSFYKNVTPDRINYYSTVDNM